jgi:hypothetical protein
VRLAAPESAGRWCHVSTADECVFLKGISKNSEKIGLRIKFARSRRKSQVIAGYCKDLQRQDGNFLPQGNGS